MEGRVFKDKAVLRVDVGEEVLECVEKFVRENNIKLASVSGIGASRDLIASVFNTETGVYVDKIYDDEFYEVTGFIGNITTKEGEPYIHIHINFAGHDNIVKGGHLKKCVIGAACELFFNIYDGEVGRIYDEDVKLNILDF